MAPHEFNLPDGWRHEDPTLWIPIQRFGSIDVFSTTGAAQSEYCDDSDGRATGSSHENTGEVNRSRSQRNLFPKNKKGGPEAPAMRNVGLEVARI